MSLDAYYDILIVDDVESCRLLLKEAIEKACLSMSLAADHIKLHEVSSGLQAIKLIRTEINGNTPSDSFLVFLDIDMPEMDGLSTLKQLKDSCEDLQVVMVSAHTSVGNIKTSLEAGASGFISKPIALAKVEESLQNFINR